MGDCMIISNFNTFHDDTKNNLRYHEHLLIIWSTLWARNFLCLPKLLWLNWYIVSFRVVSCYWNLSDCHAREQFTRSKGQIIWPGYAIILFVIVLHSQSSYIYEPCCQHGNSNTATGRLYLGVTRRRWHVRRTVGRRVL